VIPVEVPVAEVDRVAGSELRLALEAYRINESLTERLQCVCDCGYEWYPGDARPSEQER
jgi:hypothetical protein